MGEVWRLSGFSSDAGFCFNPPSSKMQKLRQTFRFGGLWACETFATLYCEAGMNLYSTLYIAQHTYVCFIHHRRQLYNICMLYHLMRQHCTICVYFIHHPMQHCTTWGNERTWGANLNWQRPILLLKNCTFFFFAALVFPQNQNQRLLLWSSFPQNQNQELPSSRLASSRQSWGWQFLVTPLQTANKNAPTLSLGNYWRIIYGQQK